MAVATKSRTKKKAEAPAPVQAYKVFTHDLRPPVRGGDPVWDGTMPHVLPEAEVDRSSRDCGEGWNACREAHTALRIGGLWKTGRPSRLFRVETSHEVIERGDKLRAASWTISEEIPVTREMLLRLSEPFGALAEKMADEQLAWYEALGRPLRDAKVVEESLRVALELRGLGDWNLREFEAARAAWDARDARAARAAWAAWDARDARDARAAWAAWDARDARAARAAWAAWDARAAWAAWAAWDALTVAYAVGNGWISYPEDYLTRGLREAYRHGCAIAIPTGPKTLGWAMETGSASEEGARG